jgi:copper transport protein
VGARRRLAIALAALCAWPALASAHPVLVASSPALGTTAAAPPREVRLAFAVAVEAELLRAQVTGPGGEVVSGAPRLEAGDPSVVVVPVVAGRPGRYLARWRVLSGDGHPGIGRGAFAVGTPAAPLPRTTRGGGEDHRPLNVLARLLVLTAPAALLGLAVLRAWVVGPAWRSGGLRPPGRPVAEGCRDRVGAALAGAASGWWRAWGAAVAAGAAGLALAPVALLRSLDAGAGDLPDLLLRTRWGASWLVQAGALLAVAAAGSALRASPAARAPAPGAAWGVALVAPPAVALGAVSWAGHASSGADRAVDIGADVLHGWATAAWLGGLLGIMVVLVPALRRLDGDDRLRLAAASVVRFSSLAVGAVAVLAVTGVYRALAELSSLEDLARTPYGRALAVKLGIFAAMLAAGAYNRLVLHPRLERAALGLEPDDRGAAARLRASVCAELALGLALMTAVAVLVSLAPPA